MIDIVKRHSEEVVRLCVEHEVRCLELFGSAYNEDNFDPQVSDIDFLVEFFPMEPQQHAKCYFRLLEKLQDIFGCNIDLVESKAIHNPYLLESISKNKGEIYAA